MSSNHQKCMMTSSNENIFRVTGHLCGQFTGSRWIPHTKASDAELWCFYLICTRINGWNNGEAGDLRRYRAHYDVIVMDLWKLPEGSFTRSAHECDLWYLYCDYTFKIIASLRGSFDYNGLKLTYWCPDKMAAIFQKTFSNAFSWIKIYEFWLRFHWSLFPMVQLTIFHHWFR